MEHSAQGKRSGTLGSPVLEQPRPERAKALNVRFLDSHQTTITQNKGSQTALITRLSVSLCLDARRGTRRPLVVAFRA